MKHGNIQFRRFAVMASEHSTTRYGSLNVKKRYTRIELANFQSKIFFSSRYSLSADMRSNLKLNSRREEASTKISSLNRQYPVIEWNLSSASLAKMFFDSIVVGTVDCFTTMGDAHATTMDDLPHPVLKNRAHDILVFA